MATIDDVVSINITRDTATISRAGFGVALILGAAASGVFNAGEYSREYTSAAALLTDGFLATDSEYLEAVAAFSQQNKPEKIKVGVMTPTATLKEIVYVGSLTSGPVSVVVNGTTYSEAFDTDQATTMGNLATAIAADAGIASCSWTDGTLTLLLTSTSGVDISIGAIVDGDFTSSSINIPTQPTSNFTTDIANIRDTDDDWYGLILADGSYGDQIAAAAFVETERKLLGIVVTDAQALVSGETVSLGYAVNNSSYTKTFWVYKSDTDRIAAAMMGERLPTTPGSGTWKFKSFSGISADSLTSTQRTTIGSKGGNYYYTVGGVDILAEGIAAKGAPEYIDLIRGTAWLEARIQEQVYSNLVNNAKVPYTDVGFGVVETGIWAVLRLGVANGLLVDDDNLTVTVPKRADIAAGDVSSRNLPDVQFTATFAGATHSVKTIAGNVSI